MSLPIDEALIEATYGFCLKRVQDPNDAEELTQEILYEAVVSKNRNIENFNAWFWQMAKNRINRFYRLKQNGAVLLDEYTSVPSDLPLPEQEMLKSEEINELNYHISRLSALHRNVIIMFYLRDMSVADIAKELGVPEGTVKSRLHDARTEIKKGMKENMNYGRSSYAPAEVNMWGGYNIVGHWPRLNNAIARQIIACCAMEAKTIKEIADEIGCAPVYFESVLEDLKEHKFIKETQKGRYAIDFIILPLQANIDCDYEISLVYKDLGREMTELIKSKEQEIRAIGFYGNDMPFGELLWFLYFIYCDALLLDMEELNAHLWEGRVAKDNGKKYRISGTVRFPDEEIVHKDSGVPYAMWSNLHSEYMTSGYSRMQYGNIFEYKPFGYRNEILNESTADIFMRIFDNPYLEMTENEKFRIAAFVKSGFLKEKDCGFYPTMPILSDEAFGELLKLARAHVSELAHKYCEKINEISARILLPHVRKDLLEEYAHWILSGNFFTINYLFGYAMKYPEESGLTLPEDYENTALATYITYRK